jgi:parallel beta helix pectate lyase-like protein
MNKKWLLGLVATCLLLVVAGPVYAGPSPTDGSSQSGGEQQEVFQTALFGLGEVDLSTLGVNPTELLDVGPLLIPTSSSDGMLVVDDDLLDCPNATFTSIQAAVAAAASGDKIKVCKGTYLEQVTIPAGKDGLTLFSEGAFQAVIQAPPVMFDKKAIVRVNGAEDVTIRHFTITGPGGGPCNSIRYGVLVDGGGSALVTDNHITEIHDTPFSGCQNGLGVAVGRQLGPDGPTTGSATVVHNLIDKYQKGGVLVDNGGSTAEVAYNEVIGAGPTAVIAQNGIQASRQAHADVHHNKVSQNLYLPSETSATGILLFEDPVARVHHNDVFLNGNGIAPFTVNGTAEISYNNSRQNVDGIVAFIPTTGMLIAYNKAFENVHLDCRDDNGAGANQWVKDLGRTANPPTICKQAGPQ